jgi:hypothetical protein
MAGGLRDHFRGLQLMHWLVRVFASAIARRIAYALIALFLAWLGLSDAHAQSKNCSTSDAMCTVEEARQQCESHTPINSSIPGGVTRRNCIREGDSNSGRYSLLYWGRDSNGTEQGQYFGGYFYWINQCSTQAPYTGTGPWGSGGSAKNGSLGCRNGCDGIWQSNADSTKTWSPLGNICPEDEEKTCGSYGDGYFWNAALKVCEPPEGKCNGGARPNSLGQCAPEPCPDGMAQQADGTCKKKDNECPAGQVRSPDGKCLPGDGQCAAGEVRGPDGTCKRDSDGDGNPDPVDEESFSGGDDCSAPPACSGSPIMCGQARIQWRIDCNTRKNRNIAGGLCNAMPVCTGEKCDALEYAGLLMQWRSACALEKMAQGNGSGGGENADVRAIRDALTGSGGSVATPPDRPASDVWSPSTGQPTRPDTSGYGWGRGCPQPPAIEVMGQTIAFDITPLCRWLGLGSYFVVGLAALFCLRIIASRDA